jgi:HD superfamily phosphohydrolase
MCMMKLNLLFFLCVPVCLIADEITTFFGTFDVQDPVILALLETDAMQRLKRVEQSGIGAFVRDHYSFTRYDHSVGVFLLCRMFGATLPEQVTALLHDASHTVFSHTGDFVFDHEGEDAYQDAIHEWYIKQTDLYPVLQTYAMEYVVTDEFKNECRLLEQDLPDLCADRLEYNLDVGLREQLISRSDAAFILSHIKYVDGRWYFDDLSAARQFGLLTISLTRSLWGAVWNSFINTHAAQALKYALTKQIITADEMHFGFDHDVWQKLHTVNDAVLNVYLKQLKQYDQAYRVATDESYDYYYKPKCRAVDPWVLNNGAFVRLSQIDDFYKQAYQDLKDHCKDGWYLKVL